MALHTRVREVRQRHLQLIAQLLIKRQRLKAERIHQHMAAATRPRLSFRFIHQLAAQAAAAPGCRNRASSSAASQRHWPGARSAGSSSPPKAERCSASTRLPIAATMRLTW